MNFKLRALIALCVSTVFAQGAFGQATERESFDRKMYAVVSLPHFWTSPRQFASLSAPQKRSLLACRDVLIALFQSVESKTDFARYLSSDAAKKYRTPADLMDPETELMEVGMLDWDLGGGGKEIQFRFFVTVYSEGNWVLIKNAATLKMIGSEWRIDELDLNAK